jgi:hypothetical protein
MSILSISLIKTLKDNSDVAEYKKQKSFTIGKIIDHRISGVHENFYIEYSYLVNNIEYTNVVNYRGKYRDCYINRKCIGKEYRVYFDEDIPSKSYMDFDYEK